MTRISIFFLGLMWGLIFQSRAQLLQNTIGGTGQDICFGVSSTGGRVMYAGYTNSFGAGNSDFYLKGGGNAISKTYGGLNDDFCRSLTSATTASGIGLNYISAGSTESFGAGSKDILVVKTDDLGNVIWARTFGGGSDDEAYKVIEDLNPGVDTSYVITGYTSSFGAGGRDIIYLVLNTNGTIRTAKTFGTAGDELGNSLIKMTNPVPGIGIAGHTNSYGPTRDVVMIFIQTNGVVKEIVSFDSGQDDYCYDLITDNNATVVFTGSIGSNPDLDILNFRYKVFSGIVWAKSFGTNLNDEGYAAVIPSAGNDFFMGGYSNSGASGIDAFAASINYSTGILTSSKIYGSCGTDILYDLDNRTGFSYGAGVSNSFGNGTQDWYLNTFDANSNSSCDQKTFTPVKSNNVTITRTLRDSPATASTDITATLGTSSIAITSMNVTPTTQNICTLLPVNIGPADPTKKDTTLCAAGNYFMNADISASFPCATYLWSTGATTPTLTVSTAGLYWVQVNAGPWQVSDTVNLIFSGAAEGFTYSDTCFTDSTKFSGFGNNPTSWSWDFSDPATGAANTSSSQNPSHLFSAVNQTYTVTLTMNGSCGTKVISKNITINPLPTVSLKDTLLCTSPYIASGGTGSSYLWSTGQTTQTLSVTAGGNYWLKITKAGCSNTDTAKISFWGQGNKGNYEWYFGNKGGLNYSTSPPQAVSGNQINTAEGSSAISDPLGRLLFYTDGQTVWNKNNAVMQNGTGLKGQSASTQSSLIVPNPGANSTYYVFTVNSTDGLNYSVVDLSANGGLGNVTQKNLPLFAPTTEKLAGTKDDNGDFWIVSHDLNSNQLRAYKVDKNGVASAPVISAVGTAETSPDGYLKFSSDGTKAAVAVKGQNLVEVYDFDKTTGLFSNPVTISNAPTPYGIEFASDNSFLYVSTNGSGQVLQYDLNAGTPADVSASKTVISTDNSITYNALQLAPDGRIYIAEGGTGSGFLGVINNPSFDSSQVAFQAKPISLGGGQSNSGLPNFITNYFSFGKWSILDADTCSGSLTLFQGSAPDSVRTWTWDFGDPASGASNTASGQTVGHTFSGPGTYTVHLHAVYHCGVKDTTKQVTIIQTPVVNLGNDTTFCTVASLQLNAGNIPAGSTYNWNTNAHTQNITVNATGKYYVDVIKGGCITSDTINLAFLNAGSLNLGNDTTLCNGQTLTLNTGAFPGATITWDNGTHLQTRTVNVTGNYYADITFGACKITDSVRVTFVPIPAVNLGSDLNLCQGTSANIGWTGSGVTYLWNTLATTDNITVNAGGQYWLDASNGGCKGSDTLNVTITQKPTVNLGPDQTFCNGSGITLDAQNPGRTYSWFDASNAQTHTASSNGIYWVDVINGPCTVRDSVTLTFIPAPIVNLGNDTTLCSGISKILNAGNAGFSYLWSNNSSASTLTVSAAGKYYVKVFQGNCSASDTINITYDSGPVLSLPSEVIFCSEDVPSIALFGGIAASYLWMPNGETTDSIHVSQEGVYTLQAKDVTGCPATASVNVLNICEAKLFVPKAFTPNGDGRNDEFQIFGLNITSFEIRIFDQWGELIFVSNDMSKSWDGKSRGQTVVDGAYAYKIQYSGETRNGTVSKVKVGDVTVLK